MERCRKSKVSVTDRVGCASPNELMGSPDPSVVLAKVPTLGIYIAKINATSTVLIPSLFNRQVWLSRRSTKLASL